MGNRREYLINSIVEISHELYKKGWVANHDGNITIRFEDNFLATPTSVSKADIVPEMILTLDSRGEKIHGIGKSFSETGTAPQSLQWTIGIGVPQYL